MLFRVHTQTSGSLCCCCSTTGNSVMWWENSDDSFLAFSESLVLAGGPVGFFVLNFSWGFHLFNRRICFWLSSEPKSTSLVMLYHPGLTHVSSTQLTDDFQDSFVPFHSFKVPRRRDILTSEDTRNSDPSTDLFGNAGTCVSVITDKVQNDGSFYEII